AGLVVHPAFGNWDGTLANAVLHHLTVTKSSSLTAQSPERPGIIHRLDKDTSGIMVIAKNDCTKAYLQKQFQERTVQKTYIALVHGKLEPNSGLIDAPIGRDRKDRKKMTVTPTGKPAQTAYDVLEQYDGLQSYTLLKARLLTGRTHQIRVHCASIGFPIVGDMTYGRDTDTLKRQFLHAFSLTFKLPSGETRTFQAPLSADLTGYLNSLK
ncbi:MAG TPA: RluA family pseudouridine synthase, partial [bacterium]|nr:RluA family pseudouridine synthase [bacterium]